MAAAFTRRLAGVALYDGATVTLEPVPAGRTWILRDLVVTNMGTAAGTVRLSLPGFLLWKGAVQPDQSYHLDFRLALNAGELLEINGQGAALNVVLTGYDLST